MPVRSALKLLLRSTALACALGSGTTVLAQASRDCPPTIAAAQALLARQGRLPGGSDQYPHRYRGAGVNVLGTTPSAITVMREPAVMWSFSYELPVNYQISYRRAFAAAYPTGNGFTYHCPANNQCLWSADGYGANGPQPQHPVGNLIQVGLTASYSSEGTYTLSCLYLHRRPARN